jgi:L-iditol 2-dehydrogenase
MKGVMKFAPGVGNVDVREVAEPDPPPGHVKLAVQLAGICGTDIHIYHDEFRSWPPVILGHEVTGQVVEVGAGVTRVKPGDRATTETYFSTCGKCRFCRAGQVNLCPERRSIGSAVNGGFTSYVIVPERNIHVLPDHVTYKAAVMTEPLACVVHALEFPHLQPGDVAVVAGPGAIGLLTQQVLQAAGATVVILGAPGDELRLETARTLGADHALNVAADDYRTVIMDLTGGYGADVVCECAGAGPAAQMLLELVRRGGQYAQVGLFGKPVAWNLDQLCYKELRVTGSNASVPWAWGRALDLIASGAVRTEPLVTGIYPVTEWRAAFDTFGERKGIKTLLEPV